MRVRIIATVLIVVWLLTGCSESEIKKLREKATQAEGILKVIEKLKNELRADIKTLAELTTANPRSNEAVQRQDTLVKSEQAALDARNAEVTALYAEVVKEAADLSSGDLKDALDWLKTNLPAFYDFYKGKETGARENGSKMLAAKTKIDELRSVVRDEITVTNALISARRESERRTLRNRLSLLHTRHGAIDLSDEIAAARQLAAELDEIETFPVVAGSLVSRETVVVREGLPATLAFRDDGTLRAGTTIELRLPDGWRIETPAEITSSTLTWDVVGNTAGSSSLFVTIRNERTANARDDAMTIVLRDVRIGSRLGLATATLVVNPGRVITQDFYVMQASAIR